MDWLGQNTLKNYRFIKKAIFSKNRPLAGSDRSFLTSELKMAASVTRPPHTPNFLGLVGFQTFGSNRFLVKKLPQTSRSRLELAFSAIFFYFPRFFSYIMTFLTLTPSFLAWSLLEIENFAQFDDWGHPLIFCSLLLALN